MEFSARSNVKKLDNRIEVIGRISVIKYKMSVNSGFGVTDSVIKGARYFVASINVNGKICMYLYTLVSCLL